jgi:hypothetical protein
VESCRRSCREVVEPEGKSVIVRLPLTSGAEAQYL